MIGANKANGLKTPKLQSKEILTDPSTNAARADYLEAFSVPCTCLNRQLFVNRQRLESEPTWVLQASCYMTSGL